MSEDLNIPDFDEFLNLEKYIPHCLKIEKDKFDKNNFINSTLNCLTNIISFLEYIYCFRYNTTNIFSVFENEIKEIIKQIKEKNKIYYPEQLTKLILKLFDKQSSHEPRILIDYIFNIFLGLHNDEAEKDISDISDLNFLKINEESITELNSDFIKSKKFEKKKPEEEKLDIIIKKIKTCKNCKEISTFYKHLTTFHFYLKPNSEKEYTLDDCFKDFFTKENEESEYMCSKCSQICNCESKSSFHQIPTALFILIYYENGNNNEYKDFYYNFEEIKEFTFCDSTGQIKNKKYFLSSIIVCKSPNKNEESFYTLCRKENNSDFLIYNYKEKEVRRHGKVVKRQITRLKNEPDEKKGYPFVLIYTAMKE